MNKFHFDEGKHVYTLDGKPLTGVTTILQVISKPALIPWAVKMTGDYVIANFAPNMTEKEVTDMVAEAKRQHRKKKEDAGALGTDVHKEVEDLVNNCMEKNDGYMPEVEHENRQVQHFIDWSVRNKVKFLESEIRLFSEEHWFAGTADLVLEIDGNKYVGDIKTSSGIYDEHFYQMAGYRLMLEEHGHTDFYGSVVINLKKDGTFNEDRDVVARIDHEGDLSAFMGALAIYKQKNAYK